MASEVVFTKTILKGFGPTWEDGYGRHKHVEGLQMFNGIIHENLPPPLLSLPESDPPRAAQVFVDIRGEADMQVSMKNTFSKFIRG